MRIVGSHCRFNACYEHFMYNSESIFVSNQSDIRALSAARDWGCERNGQMHSALNLRIYDVHVTVIFRCLCCSSGQRLMYT